MDRFLGLAFLFFIGSMTGWILEFFYRSIVSTKKWINPGFLTGPYLPIYGFGLCTLYLISKVDMSFIQNSIMRNAITVLFMMLAMTIIEYIAGIIFIKGMNVKLWDYSEEWGNIQGIICPLYTFFWGILGVIYHFLINPKAIESINWFYNNIAFSFFIGFFFGILIIDVVNSFGLAVKMKKITEEYNMLVKFEELKKVIQEEAEKRKEKIHYFFAFKTNKTMGELINLYKERHDIKRKS